MNWLKRLFGPRMKGLIIVKRGNLPEQAVPILRQYAKDHGAGIIFVHDVDQFRVLHMGPQDRLLVSRRVPLSVVQRIARSKPGEIIHAQVESFDDINLLEGKS